MKNPPEFNFAKPIRFVCQACGKVYDSPDQFYGLIKDYFQRIAPGEPVPAGECECGGLVHIQEPYWKNIVQKILEKSELFAMLLHIDPELDALIEEKQKG